MYIEVGTTIEIEPYGEIDVTIGGDYEPLIPGRFNGPPENCYPDEGGYAELSYIKIEGGKHSQKEIDVESMDKSTRSYLEEILMESGIEAEVDRYDEYVVSRCDTYRDRFF